MPIYRSSAREVWMIECYKYSAPLALSSENLDYNDLLFARNMKGRPASSSLKLTLFEITNSKEASYE
jgi:hypothetical protein